MIFLEIFLVGFDSRIWYPAAPSTMFDRWILWKTDCCWSWVFKFQRSQDWDELFPPSSCRAFRSIPLDLHQFEVQWWLSSVIFQTSCLEDVNLRIPVSGFAKSIDWRIFSSWFPASRARSQSSTNPAFTDFSLLLDFSGLAGFGTWRIYVPRFLATCKIFSIFLLFWILESFFCLWILLLCLPLYFLDFEGE
jgi:hypothetical protein